MSNIIDLEAICDSIMGEDVPDDPVEFAKSVAREAIKQALTLAAERGRVYHAKHDSNVQPGTIVITVRVDKASIMELMNSIK